MKNQDNTANELDDYGRQVAERIFNKLPESIKSILGLTVEDVKEDLESVLDKEGNLKAKYTRLKYTTDRCWEEECTVDECVDKIFADYEQILLG